MQMALKYLLFLVLVGPAISIPTNQCIKLIAKLEARIAFLENRTCENAEIKPPQNCQDILNLGYTNNGMYKIFINGETMKVYCDLTTDNGGWIVIQRRQDGLVDFYRNWADYKVGFGEMSSDFWIGLHNMHLLTREQNYELRIDMKDCNDVNKYASYRSFRVGGESALFKLQIEDYNGTAGDGLSVNNGAYFSTKDRDNDKFHLHCATHRTTGWWYRGNCGDANLNGPYSPCEWYEDSVASYYPFQDQFYGLKFIEMKIRPAP
ncbi:ryncolin-4 [Ciona intestinalis]